MGPIRGPLIFYTLEVTAEFITGYKSASYRYFFFEMLRFGSLWSKKNSSKR